MLEQSKSEFVEEEKLWKGPDLPPIFHPKASVGQIVLRALQIHGNKCAQISDDSGFEFSFDEILIKTIRAAQNLEKLGYQTKDIFGFVANNDHNLAPCVFAAFCMGCPINTMSTTHTQLEITRMLKSTKPRLMFCDVEVYDLVSKCLKEVGNDAKIYTFGGQIGTAEAVETLFGATGMENSFT